MAVGGRSSQTRDLRVHSRTHGEECLSVGGSSTSACVRLPWVPTHQPPCSEIGGESCTYLVVLLLGNDVVRDCIVQICLSVNIRSLGNFKAHTLNKPVNHRSKFWMRVVVKV